MFLKKYNLKSKTAVVTGAGKGLGRACAIALAEAGANLIIISRTKKDLEEVSRKIKKLRVKCKSYVCDVTEYNEIKNIINNLNIEFIDLKDELFNNFKDPIKFYTFKVGPHLNVEGYKEAALKIIQSANLK